MIIAIILDLMNMLASKGSRLKTIAGSHYHFLWYFPFPVRLNQMLLHRITLSVTCTRPRYGIMGNFIGTRKKLLVIRREIKNGKSAFLAKHH